MAGVKRSATTSGMRLPSQFPSRASTGINRLRLAQALPNDVTDHRSHPEYERLKLLLISGKSAMMLSFHGEGHGGPVLERWRLDVTSSQPPAAGFHPVTEFPAGRFHRGKSLYVSSRCRQE